MRKTKPSIQLVGGIAADVIEEEVNEQQ